MTLKDFQEYYKSISDSELLAIIDKPESYQPLAIQVATEEFAKRQLSSTTIDAARSFRIKQEENEAMQKQKVQAFQARVRSKFLTVTDNFSPIQSGITTVERTIRVITIVFAVMALYGIIRSGKWIWWSTVEFDRHVGDSIYILLASFFLPVSLFPFWKKRRIGWILLCVYLNFALLSTLWFFVKDLTTTHYNTLFFQRPPIESYLINMILLIIGLVMISRSNMRAVYKIGKNTMVNTIVFTSVISILFCYIYTEF